MFAKTFGCVRFTYNHFVADERDHYKIMGFPIDNEVSDYKEDYPFLKDVDSLALANAKLAYENAMQSFFKGLHGYPNFKKKSSRQSYTTNVASKGASNLRYDEKTGLLKLPKIKEPLQLVQHRKIKKGGILKSATVSWEPDGRYYVSLLYEYPTPVSAPVVTPDRPKVIGLDMSLPHFYVDSNGKPADMPHFYRLAQAHLAREQSRLSHMTKGSKNYLRQKRRLAKLHAKIKHQRSDFLHKLSYRLVKHYDIICIEDLNMKGMSQSLDLGKSVHDNGWGMFVGFLEYKCKLYGKTLIRVDRMYASSQTCHICGHKDPITKDLSVREWTCPVCGSHHDRDHNAAVNIRDEGLRIYQCASPAATAA
ncbi:MAG: transposase [Lachnospiraceae bacterium]|nr:transposase [Lachnospiraceae bacterium]